jgi:hypothetical protein
MTKQRSGMTMKERQLSDELDRIRKTYSFNLGLLLTDIVRKPWKLLILPVSFLKLNVDFLRNRNVRKKEFKEQKYATNADCLLLISTTEEGFASLERCALMAQEWMEEGGKKAVLISSHPSANQYAPKGAVVYPLNDPKELDKDQRSAWNTQCEQLLSNVLETHRPANALFDGPYPYRGVLNCVQLTDSTHWIWVRPEGVKSEAIAARSGMFTDVVEFNLISSTGMNLVAPASTQISAEVRNEVLDARMYGSRASGKKSELDFEKMVKPGIHFIGLKQWNDSNGGLLRARENRRLMGAILPPNLEALAVMLETNVPILCVYNNETDNDTMRKIRQGTQRSAVLFANENDPVQVEMALNTLVSEHCAMRASAKPLKRTNLVYQILSSI